MKTAKKILTLSLLGLGLALASCTRGDEGSSIFPSSSPSSSVISSSAKGEVITNDDLPKAATTYTDKSGNTQQLTRSQLYANSGNPHVNSHPTTGKKQKLLVAPIKFTKDESDPLDTIVADDALLEKIRVTFEGTDEEIQKLGGTISVQSFYEKSSYDKGAFDVQVIPTWIDFGETPKSYRTSSGVQGGVEASKRVREWYQAEYAKANHGSLGEDAASLDDLDTDDDGFIDLIWNVYAYPYAQGDTSFWWAYVTYSANPAGSKVAPNVKTLAWASTQFMTEAAGGYESRTFIHETGHTLGADDYYDYNKVWNPEGGIDYMNQNVGDHNSYTKFQYGWVEPWVLREDDLAGGKTAEITLRHASLTGDCLVLASPDYNNTAFDEYLMVELVGPYGLAEWDYKNKQGFTLPGIRVYHVDARAVAGGSFLKERVFTSPDDVGQNATDLRNDNSYFSRAGGGDYFPVIKNGKETGKKSYAQITMLEASDTGIMNKTTQNASNASLFRKNSTFSLKGSRGGGDLRAQTYMPSQTNLWNKAKVVTGGNGGQNGNLTYTIDKAKTCNFTFRVTSMVEDPTYGAVAKISVSLAD